MMNFLRNVAAWLASMWQKVRQIFSGSQQTTAKPAVSPLITSDSATYQYDALGRLTKVTWANGQSITYNYDAMGNRTSVVSS